MSVGLQRAGLRKIGLTGQVGRHVRRGEHLVGSPAHLGDITRRDHRTEVTAQCRSDIGGLDRHRRKGFVQSRRLWIMFVLDLHFGSLLQCGNFVFAHRHRAHLLEGGQRTGPVPLAQRTIAQRIKRLDTERALGILAQVVIHQRQRPGIVAVLVNTVGRSVRQRIALDHRHIRFDPALPGKRHIAVHIIIVHVDIPDAQHRIFRLA